MLPLIIVAVSFASLPPVSGNATIRAKAGPSDIVITTTDRLAGAIDSLKWNGKEFIDSTDHGRQLQSACSFDCGQKPFWPEAYNPTEAGSRKDAVGAKSSSKLLQIKAAGNRLETQSQMAFWLNPGEKSDHYPAKNDLALSNFLHAKTVTIGTPGIAHAIDYSVTFTVPKGERHTLAQFEVVTGYMPPEFRTFETYDPKTGRLSPLSDGPGEQPLPVVFSTKSGSHAMAAIAGLPTVKGQSGPGYGRWNFANEKVVKWNVVYRIANADGVPAGEYAYRVYVIVGSRDNVRVSLDQLVKANAK